MLRCFLQQRSFHQSAAQWTYTRTALRRLKKPELVALAGQHKLDSTGTKNDLIDRLLTKPQEANVTLEPSNSAESLSAKPQETNVTPKPSNSAESQQTSQRTPTPAAVSDEEGYDEQWVEAFDLKVGNRRSGVLGRERSSLFNRATSSTTHPAYVHQTVGAEPTNTPISMSAHRPTTDDEPMDPEINQHWVKVFDQRVKTRTKIMGLNTLDIDPKMPSTTESPPPASPAGNDTISAVIGTSMVVWYILGGDGIQSTFSSFFS